MPSRPVSSFVVAFELGAETRARSQYVRPAKTNARHTQGLGDGEFAQGDVGYDDRALCNRAVPGETCQGASERRRRNAPVCDAGLEACVLEVGDVEVGGVEPEVGAARVELDLETDTAMSTDCDTSRRRTSKSWPLMERVAT